MKIKNRTMRVLATVMALLLLVTCFVACGNKNGHDGKLSISVGNWPSEEGNPKGYEAKLKKAKEFEAANPGVEIIPNEWSYEVQTFLAKAEAGTLPTIYNTHFTETSKIMDLGYAADLTDALKENGYYDKFNDFTLKLSSRDGKVYMIPRNCYSLGLVLNLELFEEAGLMEVDGTPIAPKTFEELIDAAKKITEKTGKAGFVFPTTQNAGGWNFTVLAWNFGTKFVEQVDGKWKATFNSKECAEALEYLKDLKWKYNVLPSNTLVNNAEVSKLIGTSQAAMAFMAPSGTYSLTMNYNMDKDIIGYAPMPAGPRRHVTLIGGEFNVLSHNATKEEIDAALKWLEYDNVTPNLTEETKKTKREYYELANSDGRLVGLHDLTVWNEKAEIVEYDKQLISEMINVNPNHIKLFNEQKNIEFEAEVPICAQELYAILDSCIQEVLTNKDADCEKLLDKAVADFQRNYLDYE